MKGSMWVGLENATLERELGIGELYDRGLPPAEVALRRDHWRARAVEAEAQGCNTLAVAMRRTAAHYARLLGETEPTGFALVVK